MEENEWNNMIYVAGDGIISPLGFNSADTFSRVMELSADSSKESEGRLYQSHFGIPEPFFASLIDDKKLDNGFSSFPLPRAMYLCWRIWMALSLKGYIFGAVLN